MKNVLRNEFLTELLDVFDSMASKVGNDAEMELMYRLVSCLNENIEFEDID